MIDEFDDFYTDLLFEQLSANDDEIIEEANISYNDIYWLKYHKHAQLNDKKLATQN